MATIRYDKRLDDHTAQTGVSYHIPATGIANAHVATGAGILESKLSLTAATGAHHARHEPGGADAVDLSTLIHPGTHAARLAATAYNGKLWRESDNGGVVYIGNGATWDLWNACGIVSKPANETVNNGGFQDDDDLKFLIEPNEIWFAHAQVWVTSVSTTSDFQAAWSGPTGCTAAHGFPAGNASLSQVGVGTTPNAFGGIGVGLACGSRSGDYWVEVVGWFVADGSHAGTVHFRWGQNTSTAENTVVNKGSFMDIKRVV